MTGREIAVELTKMSDAILDQPAVIVGVVDGRSFRMGIETVFVEKRNSAGFLSFENMDRIIQSRPKVAA